MKRALIVVLVIAGATALASIIAANLTPDGTWRTLDAVRKVAKVVLGKRTSKMDLSKYAPSREGSLNADQVRCPSLPKNMLYTIVTPTPTDEICSQQVGDLPSSNYGIVAQPLRGWVGCIDGHDVQGANVEALGSDGKDRLASTITNMRGRFVFPNLRAGTYHLVVSSKGLSPVNAVVTVSPQSGSALCIVAAGTAE